MKTNINEWELKKRERALSGMKYFDAVLDKSAHVAGPDSSSADITLFAGLAYADFVPIGVPAELRNLSAWRARIAERPAIAG